MGQIKILDCTLRDGGYVNSNHFGYRNIGKIINALNESGIDFIESGYIKDTKESYSEDITEWDSFSSFKKEQKTALKKDKNYTLMLLGEEYKIENLPKAKGKNDIIRMSFHKKSVNKALKYSKEIIKSGYKLFLQPTVTINYTESELKGMLEEINKLKPYCVAIVDTFGEMREKDIISLSKVFDKYLDKKIAIGFHAHNNLQLAFSNAIAFIKQLNETRDIVIDTSIYGMGRGAGNLPTELVANYLNENYNTHYQIEPLLKIVDNVIAKIKSKNNWGYSLEYYLSAINSVHPSYIINFMRRKTLNTVDINELIKLISFDKKTEYNAEYANELYNTYNDNQIDDKESYQKLKEIVKDKTILLIGPGASIKEYQKEILKVKNKKDVISISVNNRLNIETDYLFISNKKRYENMEKRESDKLMITSNIKTNSKSELIFDYQKSLSRLKRVSDNSLLVILNILSQTSKKIVLAGFDGYSNENNYYNDELSLVFNANYIEELNHFMKESIDEYRRLMDIKTITPSKYL